MSEVELTAKQLNKIKRCVKGLNDVLAELQKDNPDNEMNWYLEDSANLNLMSGPSHSEMMLKANYHNVVDCFQLYYAGGGGW